MLDEGSGSVAKDGSAFNNHGSIQGANWVEGRVSGALHFDGDYDSVTVPASAALQPEHVSLALWFRADRYIDYHRDWKVLAYQGLIDCWQSSYSLKSSMWNDSGLVFMLWDGQASHRTEPIPGVWDGQWHHAVGTYDGSEIRLYVDGILESAVAWSGDIAYGLANGDDFVIGNPPTVCATNNKQYRGDIDEVQVWDRALTPREVLKLASPKQFKK